MRSIAKLTWIELKLFVREPMTMVFTFALPLIFLFVMSGVFGNTPSPEVYRGVGPTDYYVPAYIGMVMASIGVISMPVHLTGYRERGVLRRFRASSVSAWSVFGSQVVVSFIIVFICAVILTAVAMVTKDTHLPKQPLLFVPAFITGTLCFAAVGVFLGAIFPTSRAAQGIGLLLFFVMMILGGAGPPREVMTGAMQFIADATPLRYVILVLQDPWLGFGWDMKSFLITVGITAVASVLSLRFFRWE